MNHRLCDDDAAAILRQECVDLREILTDLFGSAVANQMIPEAVPRDSVMLVRHAQTIEENLRTITLPSPRIRGAFLDKNAVIARLSGLRQTVDDAVRAVAREVREAQATQAAKDATMETFDHVFTLGADVTSSLLRLAGMSEQAARVRPSSRRPSQTMTEEENSAPAPPVAE